MEWPAIAVRCFCLSFSVLERRQLPPVGDRVVPDDVNVVVRSFDLEVAVVGSEPAVDDLVHGNTTFAQREGARRFLTLVAGVALNRDAQGIVTRVHTIAIVRREDTPPIAGFSSGSCAAAGAACSKT